MIGAVFMWIIFSVIVGFIGKSRKIGFAAAFFLSLLLSPLIGIIITLVSKNKEDEAYKEKVLEAQQKQTETLQNLKSDRSLAVELEKLQELKENGTLSEDEYQKAKQKMLA